jgi:hypothetical protein
MSISTLEQTIPTLQTFPGPNRTLADSKSVLSVTDIEVQGNVAGVPPHYKMIEVVGYYDIAGGTGYAGSFLDKAAIGSCYKELDVDGSGNVIGCNIWLKRANGGVNTDWKLATFAV